MQLHDLACVFMAAAVFGAALTPGAADAAQTELRFHPNGQPASILIGGEEHLKTSSPGKGFFLRIFNGEQIVEEKLDRVTTEGDTIVVTNQFKHPRFTFKVVEAPRHLSVHLVRAEGMPTDRGASLAFEANLTSPMQVIEIDPKMIAKVKSKALQATRAYLWHQSPDDPLGAFALYADGADPDNDLALAEIWATEPLPRPAG